MTTMTTEPSEREEAPSYPERYWLIASRWGFLPQVTKPTKSAGVEYIRADIYKEGFEKWWDKNGDKSWSVKHAAREGWHASAHKDKPSECFDRGYLGGSLEGHSDGYKQGYDDAMQKLKVKRDEYESRRASETHPAFAHYYTVCRNAADEIITVLEAAANSVKDSEREGVEDDESR